MAQLGIGKVRGLQRISFSGGVFAMAAIDHRQSLQNMIGPGKPDSVSYEKLVEIKKELTSILGPIASAVLLDPLYGAAQCISSHVLRRDSGLLVSVEGSGYTGTKTARMSGILQDWGVDKIKRMGADGVKLLVYYRREAGTAAEQIEIVRQVAEQCMQHDIPAVVEAVSHPVADETAHDLAAHKPRVVVETAKDLTALPMDVFKAEFPADMLLENDEGRLLAYCQQLDSASRTPWVILSAGVNFDQFLRQVDIACRGGASGFLGGRAIWQEGVAIPDGRDRIRFFETVAADRLRRLVEVAGAQGRPWWAKLGLPADRLTAVTENWYAKY